jgi:hypothetical protein
VRANLVDGRAPEPASLAAAEARVRQLAHEIRKAEARVAPQSPGKRARVEGDLAALREERRQLEAWIARAEERAAQAFWRDL